MKKLLIMALVTCGYAQMNGMNSLSARLTPRIAQATTRCLQRNTHNKATTPNFKQQLDEMNKSLATTVKLMGISCAGMTGCIGLVGYHIYRLEKIDGELEQTSQKVKDFRKFVKQHELNNNQAVQEMQEVADMLRQHRIELENENRKNGIS